LAESEDHQKKKSRKTEPTENIQLSNRFNALPEPIEEKANETKTENKIPKPAPIFIYGVTNYEQMVDKLRQILRGGGGNSILLNAWQTTP
jgi:hypothetical protein